MQSNESRKYIQHSNSYCITTSVDVVMFCSRHKRESTARYWVKGGCRCVRILVLVSRKCVLKSGEWAKCIWALSMNRIFLSECASPPFHLFTSRLWKAEHTSYSSAPQPAQGCYSLLFCFALVHCTISYGNVPLPHKSEVGQNLYRIVHYPIQLHTPTTKKKVECPPNVVSTYLWQEGSRREVGMGRKARGRQTASSAFNIPL